MKVYANGPNYILEVPREHKDDIANLMAYRGLTFSLSASRSDTAVLFSVNPYALADLGNGVPALQPYYDAVASSRAEEGVGTYKLPPGKELAGYQKASLDYILERDGGILGDQPGLGKTPMAIALANEWEAYRVLVIVPASIRIQWGIAIEEWSTIPNVNISVMTKPKDGIHPFAHYQVLSYDTARNPAIMRAIQKYDWDLLVCDEAHKMKNIDALTTRAILGNAKGMYVHGEYKMPAISKSCKRHIALTGTLLLNRPSEAFALLRFFDHEAIDFSGWEAFKARYNKQAAMKSINGKRFTLENTALENELQNRLRVNVLTRHEKKDVQKQIPVPRYSIIRLEEDGAIGEALEAEGLLGLSVEELQTTKDFEILGHIAEARRLMGEAMAPRIVEYLSDILEGSEHKIVLFGWHINVLDIFEEGLKKYGTVRVDGKKNAKQRHAALTDFVDIPGIRVFIGNLQSAGTGLDGLQKVCSQCYLAEPDWVPAQNEQAVSRLDRYGQKEVVNAGVFVAPGSLSEKIFVRALEKMNTIYQVLDQKGE